MTDVSEVGLADVAVGTGLVGLVLVGLTAGLVVLGDLPPWRGAVTATVVLGIPSAGLPAALAVVLAGTRGSLSDPAETGVAGVVVLVPVAVPIHLAVAVDPFVAATVTDLLLGEYPVLALFAVLLQVVHLAGAWWFLDVVDAVTPAVVGRVEPIADRLGLSVRGDSEAGRRRVLDRLADSRLWETESVTADRASLDCDRCDRSDVPGVRRTTVGGVAGYPLREASEDVCRECRESDGDRPD